MRDARELDELVLRLTREIVPWRAARRKLTADAILDDLGIDSLGKFMLAFRLADELGLDLEEQEVDLGSIETIGDIQLVVGDLVRHGETP
jgi:acyl carrier protein